MNIAHMREICDEISRLEKRVKQISQQELNSVLSEFIGILQQSVPQLKQIVWQHGSANVALDTSVGYYSDDQKRLVASATHTVSRMDGLFKLAFGDFRYIIIDVESATVMRER